MKKNKTLSLALIFTMLLLPFVNTVDVSGAPPPSYVGVSEGDTITWDITLDQTAIETMANDIDTAATEIKNFIADDTNGLEAYIDQLIPNNLLGMNLSAAICGLLENATSGIPIMPDEWLDMEISELLVNILNNTLPPGFFPSDWIDNMNMTDLACLFLENLMSGLWENETWTNYNITAFLDLVFETFVDPTGIFEAGWLDNYNLVEMFDVLIANLTKAFENLTFLDGWTDFNVSTLLLNILENLTAPVMPAGWLDMDIKTTLTTMLESGVLTSAHMDLNLSEFIGAIIENLTAGFMPAGWMDLTLEELLLSYLTLFEDVIDPEWMEIMQLLIQAYLYSIPLINPYMMGSMYMYSYPMSYMGFGMLNDYTIQQVIDKIVLEMQRSTQTSTWGNFDIEAITANYAFTTNDQQFEDTWIDGYVVMMDQFSNPTGQYFKIQSINRGFPTASNCTIGIDSTGLTQTLTEMGIDDTYRFYVTKTFIYDSPILGASIRDLLDMASIYLPTIPCTMPITHGISITSIESDTQFSVASHPDYQSWVGGVASIWASPVYYMPVTQAVDNGTHILVDIEPNIVNLTDYYSPGYMVSIYGGPFNFSSASFSDIINLMTQYVMYNASTLSIDNLIDWSLNALNVSMPIMCAMYGIDCDDFLSLSVREALYLFLEFYNQMSFYRPFGNYISGSSILEVTGDYEFIVGGDATNDTWIGGVVSIYNYGPMQFFTITSVTDNGDNITVVIEDQPYTLTEMGYGFGNSTNFYEPGFMVFEEYLGLKLDLFNITLNSFLNLIPGFNSTLPDILDFAIDSLLHVPYGESSFLTTMTIREMIDYGILMLNQTVYPFGNIGPSTYWSTSIFTIEGDFSFTTNGYISNYNELIGGVVMINSDSTYRQIINVEDIAGSWLNITLAPISSNNLTNLGYTAGMNLYFMGTPTQIFQFDLASDTIDEIIHEAIGFLNYTTFYYINAFNEWMNHPNGLDYYLTYLELLGYFDSTMGLRLTIDQMGEEIEFYPGGPRGVPINITLEFSPDKVNWMEIPINYGSIYSVIGTLSFAWMLGSDFFIIDPSSVPGEWLGSLPMQLGMSFGLLMSNDYDWTMLNSEITIPSGLNLPGLSLLQDLDEINFGISWTTDGILDEAIINYGGVQVVRIGTPVVIQQLNVPGFDLPILIGVSAIGAIGVIYIVMKKKRI